ncbi:hypothetical protein ACI2K4_13020 [Micromonospora sp. NPDC050397]|uniref:hypothetical protein n=1 Tax=Micromonospora sp. NPDC050397 TaxID=3364279 RepID=UPI003850CFE2
MDHSEISLRPWRQRIATCPGALGRTEDIITDLRALLKALGTDGLPADANFAVGSGRSVTVREATRYLTTIGLARVQGGRLGVTRLAASWLEAGDDRDIVRILHSAVQYVGEVLAVLANADGRASHDELLDAASKQYGMSWTSLDPIRRRTSWLRSAHLVDLFDGQVHLTDEGAAFLKGLDVAEPLQPQTEDLLVQVSPATPEVLSLLEGLTEQRLQERDRVANYFATPGDSVVDALHDFVLKLRDRSSESAFVEYVGAQCKISRASASMMLGTIRKLGLAGRVGPDAYQATALGLAWSEDGDRIDLIRIAHARLWGIGELLDLLDASPKAGQGLLKTVGLPSAARDRLRLLVECGLAEKFDHTRYVITALGRAVREELPRVSASNLVDDPVSADVAEIVERDSVGAVIDELQEAAVCGEEPARLERALGKVLQLLGLADVTVLGQGPGRTDVLATLPVPWYEGTTICFDAKASSSALVPESQVSFAALGEHRAKHSARWSVLVGPAFHSRVHTMAANDGHVTVLDASYLGEVLQAHVRAPFLPEQLVVLFDPRGSADRAQLVQHHHLSAERVRDVLRMVLCALEIEAREPLDDGWLTPLDVVRMSRQQVDLSVDEVKHVLAGICALPWVQGIQQDKDRFRLVAPVNDVLARLRFLGST